MAEHRSATREPQTPPEARDVNINDIAQRTVDSTTTILTAPDGTIATVHLAWIMTLDPLDDNDESFITDENGVLGDQDRELVEDGNYVLTHGCMERDYYHIKADPTAVRGYAVAQAADYLVRHVVRSGYKVEPPEQPVQNSTPPLDEAPVISASTPKATSKAATTTSSGD